MPKTSTSFQKGNQAAKGKGRKGYEIEALQMKRMSRILNRMLGLSEQILDGKANFKDQIKYETLQRAFLKIMDKIHPNKTEMDITSQGKPIFQPDPEEKKRIDRALQDLE